VCVCGECRGSAYLHMHMHDILLEMKNVYLLFAQNLVAAADGAHVLGDLALAAALLARRLHLHLHAHARKHIS
jgi:hypothetical protein